MCCAPVGPRWTGQWRHHCRRGWRVHRAAPAAADLPLQTADTPALQCNASNPLMPPEVTVENNCEVRNTVGDIFPDRCANVTRWHLMLPDRSRHACFGDLKTFSDISRITSSLAVARQGRVPPSSAGENRDKETDICIACCPTQLFSYGLSMVIRISQQKGSQHTNVSISVHGCKGVFGTLSRGGPARLGQQTARVVYQQDTRKP